MNRNILVSIVTSALLVAFAASASADNSRGCAQKRLWQKQVINKIVSDWFAGAPNPDDLLGLIQAEQGRTICEMKRRNVKGLHTPNLPRDLKADEVGGILLASELEWADLLPEPGFGIEGRTFYVLAPERVALGDQP